MSSDDAVDPVWDDYEADQLRRLRERVAEIIELDPEDRLGLVSENLVIRR